MDTYHMRLFHAAGDTLIFAEETLNFRQTGWPGQPKEVSLGSGHQETHISDAADGGEPTARVLRHLLNHCRVYQFHDTSATARIRQYCYVGDKRWLMPDAGNLAAILYHLRQQDTSPAYKRIVGTVRQIAPFIGDFETKLRLTGPHGRRDGRILQGGMFYTFAHALADMKRWLLEDTSSEAQFSMMVDLYSLPHDVPGHAEAMVLADPYAQAEMLEAALDDAMQEQRFIPYIQVHEFEAPLLSAPGRFSERFEQREKQIAMLRVECNRFASPELINDGQHTHPKARIKKYFADYGAKADGPLLAQAIGLHQIRQKCPHFDQWLTTLENLDREGM